jgi:hypothetical protein
MGCSSPSCSQSRSGTLSLPLSGPVKDALCECHFANDKEVKQSFCDVLQSQGREFYNNGILHITQCWQKRVENDEDCEKNYLMIAKDG